MFFGRKTTVKREKILMSFIDILHFSFLGESYKR